MGPRRGCPTAIGRLAIVSLAATLLVSLLPPAAADSGGPDTYGYRWVDSKLPNPGVTFGWIDGVTGGRDLLLGDEDCTSSRVPFGFAFGFYGISYNEVYVCANGFIAFNTPSNMPQYTDAFAAALGADLDPSAPNSGHVYAWSDVLSSPRRFIVTWNGVYTYGYTDPQRFEIVLTEDTGGRDGRILFQYALVTNPPAHIAGIDSIGSTSSLYYTYPPPSGAPRPLENSLAVLFLPPGAALPGDVLTARATYLAPLTVEPGQSNITMLRLNLSTPTNSVSLRRIRVDVTGITSMPRDVSRVALWRDADRDGQLNRSLDTLVVAATPTGGPESAFLTLPAPRTISAGPGESFFVVFDVPLTAVPGDWIGAGVLGPSYVTVDPPDNVSAANFPIDTYVSGNRTRIVEGTDTLRVASWAATNPANVTQWQTDVPMFRVTVDADKGAVTITQVTTTFLGARPADVLLVKLFEETTRDLVLQPGRDRFLAKSRFNVTGNASLPLNLQVLAGVPRTLWLSYDIAPDAVPADVAGARLPTSAAISIRGTMDRVDPASFPVQTPTPSTVLAGPPPVIESRWAVSKPVPDGRVTGGEYILSSRNSRELSTVGGNTVASLITVENDIDYLYLVQDTVGDVSPGANDSASIAFRTNRTAFPSAPPDDEFGVGGVAGPFHAVWNGSALGWRIEDNCSASFDANHTGLACAMGFDRSPVGAASHRIYEFRIPLRLLEVPVSFPPGFALGFAAQSNWSQGVRDGDFGGNSSWPFSDPAMPPRWYGVLKLAGVPPVNNPPRLDWTGEAGFVGDGVSPDNGTTLTSYEFRIRYTDANGDPPALGDPRLHVLLGASEITDSPFSMVEADPADTNVTDGKVYTTSPTLDACPQTYSYFLTAWDDRGANATPTAVLSGPTVRCPPAAPRLSNGTVTPVQGFTNISNFTWSVEYRDADGDQPIRIDLAVSKGGSRLFTVPMRFQRWLGGVNDFIAGAVYNTSKNLSAAGGDYSFSFIANDTLLGTMTPPTAGPTVVPEPSDLLLVSFSNDAPLVEDQGRRNVKMFTAILQAKANTVFVTGLRIDRTGSSLDSDVAAIRAYHDVDGNGIPSGPDVFLGEGRLLNGSIALSGFLVRVTAGLTEQLIVLVDIAPNATADDQVSLRVLDARSIFVAYPDLVAPFSTFASTNLLVNGAPTVRALTADGGLNGTAVANHIMNPTPQFAWTFEDPNSFIYFLQRGYNVSLFSGPSGSLLWYSNATGSANSVVYGGPPLANGTRYRVEVRVFDGRVWGRSVPLWIRLNTPPPVPALSTPPDGATDQGPDSVILEWSPVTDADGDLMSYRWSLSTRADFVGARNGTTPIGTTTAAVPTAQATTYYWRVEGFDQFGWSQPSASRMFTTGATSGGVFGRVVHAGTGLIAVVRMYDSAGRLAVETTTTSNGAFAISGIPFGVYELQVASPTYSRRAISNVILSPAASVVNLGNIELTPEFDWSAIAFYAILIVVVASVLVAGIVLARRRRSQAQATEATPVEESAPSVAVQPAEEALKAEEPSFECPECGTEVTAEATSCPGCGAMFE